jgi:hypothetical protein
VLPGPFRERVVDPSNPRVLQFGDVRGLIATTSGPVVIGHDGRQPIAAFAVAALPIVNGTVIIDERLAAADAEVAERVRVALSLVSASLPGRLERVTIGGGAATLGEARVSSEVDAGNLVASAHAAFVNAAAAAEAVELVRDVCGTLVDREQRLGAVDVLARACANVNALPWRADRAAVVGNVQRHLDDVAVIGDPTATGSQLIAAVRATVGDARSHARYSSMSTTISSMASFQRSVERRCRAICTSIASAILLASRSCGGVGRGHSSSDRRRH